MTILITGSEGLIGRHLTAALDGKGISTRSFDILRDEAEDLRVPTALLKVFPGVSGIVHLGGVSRVVWGQADPQNCIASNTEATNILLSLCVESPAKPWVIYASSREVYGEQPPGLIKENAVLRPMNVYAKSKRDCERLCDEAKHAGLLTNVVRFSSVYGCDRDHADRVVPAFCRIAAFGGTIQLEGPDHIFDFTHVSDVTRGVVQLIEATIAGEALPPLHLVTGRGTSLADLAATANCHARVPFKVQRMPPRNYDVSRFVGDPTRALGYLGWRSRIDVAGGVRQLVKDFAESKPAVEARNANLASRHPSQRPRIAAP